MSREIRFRAWDKISKSMRYHAENSLMVCLTNPNDFELMQFTGLKDKNEVEIYEGDILVGAFVDSKPCQVVYRPPVYLVQFPYYDDPTLLMVREIPDKKHREVIGNIWENPELLKGGLK